MRVHNTLLLRDNLSFQRYLSARVPKHTTIGYDITTRSL